MFKKMLPSKINSNYNFFIKNNIVNWPILCKLAAANPILHPIPNTFTTRSGAGAPSAATQIFIGRKSFNCLNRQNPNLGFETSHDVSKFNSYKSDLDLPLHQLFKIAKAERSMLRLALMPVAAHGHSPSR